MPLFSPHFMLFLGTVCIGLVSLFVSCLIAVILKHEFNVDSTWEPFVLAGGFTLFYFSLVFPLIK